MPPSSAPQSVLEDLESHNGPEPGVALCLSGGGFRAALFHAGALIRLNETGVLAKLTRVSSVSGGSMVAALLGMNWTRLKFSKSTRCPSASPHLSSLLIEPLRRLTSQTLDRSAFLDGLTREGRSPSHALATHLDFLLYHEATLQSLPSDEEGPRFVINAASLQTGSLVRFSRPYVADYKVGVSTKARVSLATAVAASAAFPPVFAPALVDLADAPLEPLQGESLTTPSYRSSLVLCDGGVYDNLGLETVIKRCKTILVSDGGLKFSPDETAPGNILTLSKRVFDIADDQVGNLRKRWLIENYKSGVHDGSYWGIGMDASRFDKSQNKLDLPFKKTHALANLATRLTTVPTKTQNQLMNWGYAACDISMRAHAAFLLPEDVKPPTAFPFPDGVG